MDRYARGDEGAFRTLHRMLGTRLVGFFLRMRGSRAAAEDLAQETWLRIHRGRSTFAQGGAVMPWVYTIARNTYRDHARSARLRAAEPLAGDAGVEPADLSGSDAEAEAMVSETAHTVERVLSGLPASQREAFVLLRYEGLSVEDAAAVLGATPTAVKLRAFRACEALRAALDVVPSRRARR